MCTSLFFPSPQKELFRCISNSRSANKTDDEQNLADAHTNAGPEVDVGELDPVSVSWNLTLLQV